MTAFVALYRGPGGPISAEVDAEDIAGALAIVEAHGRAWYDAGEDALGLGPDAPTEDIESTLAIDDYTVEPVATTDDGRWTLHAAIVAPAIIDAALQALEQDGMIVMETDPATGEVSFRLTDKGLSADVDKD